MMRQLDTLATTAITCTCLQKSFYKPAPAIPQVSVYLDTGARQASSK